MQQTRGKEYYNENKDDILKNHHEYYKTNMAQILEYKKKITMKLLRKNEYYKRNKDTILQNKTNIVN